MSYDLEYGSAQIEMHDDNAAGARVLLLDDVLATGGTLRAGRDLLQAVGSEVVGIATLLEIDGLGGREVLGDDVHAVFRV